MTFMGTCTHSSELDICYKCFDKEISQARAEEREAIVKAIEGKMHEAENDLKKTKESGLDADPLAPLKVEYGVRAETCDDIITLIKERK